MFGRATVYATVPPSPLKTRLSWSAALSGVETDLIVTSQPGFPSRFRTLAIKGRRFAKGFGASDPRSVASERKAIRISGGSTDRIAIDGLNTEPFEDLRSGVPGSVLPRARETRIVSPLGWNDAKSCWVPFFGTNPLMRFDAYERKATAKRFPSGNTGVTRGSKLEPFGNEPPVPVTKRLTVLTPSFSSTTKRSERSPGSPATKLLAVEANMNFFAFGATERVKVSASPGVPSVARERSSASSTDCARAPSSKLRSVTAARRNLFIVRAPKKHTS